MTPPSVQFIPASASATFWQIDATCGNKSANDLEMGLSSPTETGNTASFDQYLSNPVRRQLYWNFIEHLFLIDVTGDFASVGDFQASTSNRVYTMSIDGVLFNPTSVTEIRSSSTLMRARFNASPATVQAYWNAITYGDSYRFTLSYS